jgi:hypothetical protein
MEQSIDVYSNRNLNNRTIEQTLGKLLAGKGERYTSLDFSKPSDYNLDKIRSFPKGRARLNFAIISTGGFQYTGRSIDSLLNFSKKAYHGIGNLDHATVNYGFPTYTRVYLDRNGSDPLMEMFGQSEGYENTVRKIREQQIGHWKSLVSSHQGKNEQLEFINVGRIVVEAVIPEESKGHVVVLDDHYVSDGIEIMKKRDFLDKTNDEIAKIFRDMQKKK